MSRRLILNLLCGILLPALLGAESPSLSDHAVISTPDVSPSLDKTLSAFPPGKLRSEDIRGLKRLDGTIADLLSRAPNDSTGKQSIWYPRLQTWKAGLDKLVSSGKQTDAFAMIPLMAEFFTRNKSKGQDSDYLSAVEIQMDDCGYYLIMAAGAYTKQHNGNLDPATLSVFVKLFSVHGFSLEPDWESEDCPIGPADLMIINADAVVKELETAPWQQADEFIGNRDSADIFFEGFHKGYSLPGLKAKYAKNKAKIDAKFRELLQWEWMQQYMPGYKASNQKSTAP